MFYKKKRGSEHFGATLPLALKGWKLLVPHALKGQKLLAQGIALGMLYASLSP
nr:hypothetical protein [Prevotella sp.]